MIKKFNHLLKISEVAKILRLSSRTVYRLIKNKKIKAIKISESAYRISNKDLQSFLKKHKTK